ncbi:sensor domain-containing diguanylate cyclase [Vibrio sp. VPAP30]|uniref:sensor domain-containing diguanylate cyclase n=1 Tax=Vibrio sp. VPAP30 TaxID=1647102 RepID=UPI000676272E|nr:diguanylate cyclase [Vibrio sp. VPAP30]
MLYNFKHLSIRQITIFVSMIAAVLFLFFYLSFKLLWSHDQALEQSKNRQQFELERVETVLSMEELELRASIEDYAAWTTMARYVDQPNDLFINESIGPHAFSSKHIDAIVIFDPDVNTVWSGVYNGEAIVNMSFLALEKRAVIDKVLSNAVNAQQDTVQSFVDYAVYNDSVFMVASSRICLSDGKECEHGYLLFIRKIREEFIKQIEASTGVGIYILPSYGEVKNIESNSTILYRDDVIDDALKIAINVSHNEILPEFLPKAEIAALSLFALITFAVNLYVVTNLVKPLKAAQQYLKQFQKSGDRLPSEDTFISKEMRSFARQINDLINELEDKRAILRKQSTIDSLTQIANRRLLYETAHDLIETLEYKYIAVILIDVDHFKLFNDNYGHLEGDEALRRVAKALQSVDTRYEKLVSRYGGEEFCILLAGDHPLVLDGYLKILVNCVDELGIKHEHSPTSDTLTISVGATSGELDSYSQLSHWFQKADQALYEAKNNGRNGFHILW